MTQLHRFPWSAAFVVMFLLLPGKIAAQSGTVTDDAFVSSNSVTQLANANGQGIALVVAGSSATVGPVHVGTTRTFIKFQLQSSLPPSIAAANVAKATLKLFISPSCNPSGAIDIYPVTSAWTESTLNPSSLPTLSSTAFATAVPVGKANSFWVVDVTQLVKDWLEGSANGGLDNDGIALVADTTATNVIFDSKESFVTSHEPRLEIVLDNSGPQGPAGPQGSTGPIGPQGSQGSPGLAATITVGTTTTVPAGTPATVLTSGTPNAPVLNFLIPQGAAGATGAQGPQGLVGPQGPTGQTGPQGLQGPAGIGIQGLTGPQGPAGPQGPVGPAGTSSGGGSNSLLSAFLPGPLTQAYTGASFVPDSAITVTHISAALKTAPDVACAPTVLRVTDGSTGQDIRLLGGQAGKDTGAMSLEFKAGASLQVQVQTPANCKATNPADANVLVEYRGQLSGDQETCAQSGLACNGICEETQTDPNNCGSCGNICPTTISPFCLANPNQCIPGQLACVSGVCGGCAAGLGACSGACTNLQSDPSNCGACGTVCSSSNPCAVPVCSTGSCGSTFVADGTACGGGKVCTSGICAASACTPVQHSNGAGQSYADCAPLGSPGNPATYTQTMASEAAAAFSGTGFSFASCGGASAVTASSAQGFAVWIYDTTLAGHVLVSSTGFFCPSSSDPAWN